MNPIWIIQYNEGYGIQVHEFFYTSRENLEKAFAELQESDKECGIDRVYTVTKLYDGGENA